MTTRTVLGRTALFLTIVGLAACSTGTQPITVLAPAPTASLQQDSVHRKPQFLSAFAADCTSVTGSGVALCSNIELASSTTYGPTTPAASVPGFHPADLQAAYRFPSSTAGHGQTIAIVVAGADPNAEADLAVYRSTFNLGACSVASGCLKLLQPQTAIAVTATSDWAREAATGLDMASAICPNCKLMLYQTANTKDYLAQAISNAANAGATVVSNSFTIPERSAMSTWTFPSVPVIAAAGDSAYGAVFWPAAASNVIAVGGTTLTKDSSSRGWSEAVWSATSSGCSAVAAKPAWQKDAACSGRTIADIAAVGDPNTPVAIYNTYQDSGWERVGGTSVAAPIIAGAYGLAGNGATLTGAASIYSHLSSIFPVTSGSNGSCSAAYLCNGFSGYNGPTGWGTPNGIGAL